jgi:hypothetical protein
MAVLAPHRIGKSLRLAWFTPTQSQLAHRPARHRKAQAPSRLGLKRGTAPRLITPLRLETKPEKLHKVKAPWQLETPLVTQPKDNSPWASGMKLRFLVNSIKQLPLATQQADHHKAGAL